MRSEEGGICLSVGAAWICRSEGCRISTPHEHQKRQAGAGRATNVYIFAHAHLAGHHVHRGSLACNLLPLVLESAGLRLRSRASRRSIFAERRSRAEASAGSWSLQLLAEMTPCGRRRARAAAGGPRAEQRAQQSALRSIENDHIAAQKLREKQKARSKDAIERRMCLPAERTDS